MPTHDNLPMADGNEENKIKATEETLDNSSAEVSESDSKTLEPKDAIDKEMTDAKTSIEENLSESEDTMDTKTEENVADDIHSSAKDEIQDKMDEAVAEDSEDEVTLERHDIEKKDYHAMTKDQLITELRLLIKNEKIQAIKEHVEEIKSEFNAKFNEEVEQKKDEFLAEGGNIIDFYYSTPLKKEFNSVYFDYKEKRNTHYQNLKKDLQANLQKRLNIIEELKGLLNVEENINTTYNHFKDIK